MGVLDIPRAQRLTMKNIKNELVPWVVVGTIGITWIAVLLLYRVDPLTPGAILAKIPEVVTGWVILMTVFARWAWKWKIFQWLVVSPDLSGTWEGTIESDWEDPTTGKTSPPIQTKFIIRHKFDCISCELFTGESSSQSRTMTVRPSDDGIVDLVFDYINIPKSKVRGRSQMHQGAACLRLSKENPMTLEGSYWTDRKTTGDLSLVRTSFDV